MPTEESFIPDGGAEAIDATPETSALPRPADDRSSLREELARARAAYAASQQESPPAGEAPAPPAPAADASPAPAAAAASSIDEAVQKALAAREAEHRAREEERAKWRAEGEREKARILAEAEAKRKEADALIERLRTNPVEAIRMAGWDPQKLVLNLAEEGTPTAQTERMLLQLQARLDAEAKARAELEATIRAQKEAEAQAAAQAEYRKAVNEFFGEATKKYPAFSTFQKSEHLTQALAVEARSFVEQEMRRGVEPTYEQVADHLAQRYGFAAAAAQPPPAPRAPQPTKGVARAGLTQTQASEKRAPSKSPSEMSERELNALIREEMALARKSFQSSE